MTVKPLIGGGVVAADTVVVGAGVEFMGDLFLSTQRA